MQLRTHIGHARLDERVAIARLLASAGLGSELAERHIGRWVVAREGDEIVACGMLEVAGGAALLRHIAVASDRRRRSIGSTVVSVLLDDAAEAGVSTVFAFPREAAGFFRRLRWQPARATDAFVQLGIAPPADSPVFAVLLAERARSADAARRKTA